MVGVNTMSLDPVVKQEILQFMNEKTKLEKEIQELFNVLKQNNVGMNEPLVDQDGFPRNDIDVFQVRHTRHRIICLQNDHKGLMRKIEVGLHKLHSGGTESTDETMDFENDSSLTGLEPFARITVVSPGSPAQVCGLQLNDKILQFGSVTSSNFQNMSDIAVVVRHSSGTKINVVVRREGRHAPILLELTPQVWSGQGLLGCKIDPVETVER